MPAPSCASVTSACPSCVSQVFWLLRGLATGPLDRVPVLIAIHVNEHRRAPARRELADDLLRYDDPGVVAARGNGRLE